MSHVVREALVTTDLRRFLAEGMAARAESYAGHSLPASAPWVEVPRLAQPEFLFEVEVTAVVPRG
jgi:enamine deaminase RidA (YjgF/YER057c/UK114 family)